MSKTETTQETKMEITRLTKEYDRIARLMDAAEERQGLIGTGTSYGETYAQAESRARRNRETIRKHARKLASLDAQIKRLETERI